MITRTAKGVAETKSNGTTLQKASVAIAENASIVVNLAHDPVTVTSVKWNSIDLTKVIENTSGSGVQGSQWVLHNCTAATGNVDVVFASAIDAKALNVLQLLGENSSTGGELQTDQSSSGTGSGTSPNSGATAAQTFEGEIAIGAIMLEALFLSVGSGDFTSIQGVGTSGGASDTNIGVADFDLQLGESSAAVTFSRTGVTSGNWVAIVVTYRENTAAEVRVVQEFRSVFYEKDRVQIAQENRSIFYTKDRAQVAQEYRTWWYTEGDTGAGLYAAIL